MKKLVFVFFVFLALFYSFIWAGPISMTSSPLTYSQNFNTLNISGTPTWTDDSTIAGWYAQRTGSGYTIVADAGSGTAGNLYSYGPASNSDRALGTIGSSGAAAGSFAHGVLLKNDSGFVITSLTVGYTGEQWRNSAAAAQIVSFYYQISASAISSLTPTINTGWTAVSALNFTSPVTGGTAGALSGNLPANRTVISGVVLNNLNIAASSYIMLKWEDPDHSGTDHGLAIEDVSISWIIEQNPPPDTPITLDATNVASDSFVANWNAATGATSYRLDVYSGTPATQLINTGFEGSTSFPAGWTQNSSYVENTASNAHSGTYYAGMNSLGDYFYTPRILSPTTISFWIRTSSANVAHTIKVQSSTNASTWTDLATFVADGAETGDITSTYSEKVINANLIGNYYIRWFMSARTGGSSYFDDVLIVNGTINYVAGYNNLTVLGTSQAVTGLNPNTTYYYVVRAVNDNGTSPSSNEMEVITNEYTLPVELSSFTAVAMAQNYVVLNWTTQTETNLAGFYLYRGLSSDLIYAERIPSLIAPTNTSQQADYVFVDWEVSSGNTYYYWLQNIDLNGESDFHGPVSITLTNSGNTPPIPTLDTQLLAAYPNPFDMSTGTRIHYYLKNSGNVKIDICNLKGQLIRSSTVNYHNAGDYFLKWDGKDFRGKPVSSGIYYYKMSSGKYTSSRKVILLK